MAKQIADALKQGHRHRKRTRLGRAHYTDDANKKVDELYDADLKAQLAWLDKR